MSACTFFLVLSFVYFLLSIVVCFSHHVLKFAEPGTEGDRSNRGVSDG